MNEGRCLCGGVTWVLTAEPFAAYNCYCRMCQKVHGTPFGTYYLVRPDQIRWTSETDTIVRYRSSHFLTRCSCDVCGSVVPFLGRNGERWAAPAGCHDHGKKADCNIFVADNAPWHEVTGDLPRHDDVAVSFFLGCFHSRRDKLGVTIVNNLLTMFFAGFATHTR